MSGRANISGTAGILEASFGGSYFRTDGISSFDGPANAERDASRIYALNGRLKANLTETFSLDFRGYFTDAVLNFDSNASNFFTGENSGGANSLAIAYNKQFVGYAGANLDLADGRFRNRVAYTRTDVNRRGIDPVAGTYNNYLVTGTIDRFEYRGVYDLADIASIAAGAEFEKIHSSTSYEGAAPDLANSNVASGYGQLSLRPMTGLTLTGGVRYDSYTDYGGHTSLGGNLAYGEINPTATVIAIQQGADLKIVSDNVQTVAEFIWAVKPDSPFRTSSDGLRLPRRR